MKRMQQITGRETGISERSSEARIVSMLAAASVMALQVMDTAVIVAAYNGLSGFGRVDQKNLAFTPLSEACLIHDDGLPADAQTLLKALEFEINRRLL